MPPATPIAIVGAACRLPGAPDPDALWSLLAAGRDAVTSVPEDRFPHAAFLHPRRGEPGRSYTFAAGTLGDVHGFDAAAFGLSPREAAEMDPQQRLLLELAQEAIEDAAWLPSGLAGSATGVFVGASLTDHANLRQADPASGDRYFMTGGALSVLANRIGHVFDLRGGAETIDTACSSGLVALHRAARALAEGALSAAIVGGVNLLLSPFPFIGFARAGMLSPSGRCHAFDARADGYVRAEGGVVLVLKRLTDALAAGDAVRAVLLGSGVNGAGRTLGISLPSGAAQRALLEQVMAAAAISPDRLGYFEAHGTGTAAGDPIETAALGAAIGQHRRRQLPIGSLKTNIGHTEAASGLAGVLKAVLMLERRQVPPSLHFAAPNPAIDFAALRLRVATAPERLAARAVIGVNSFGFGGTNACALLASPPTARGRPGSRSDDHAAPPPLLLSARSPGAVRLLAARWRDTIAATPAVALPALLRGAARHRDLLPYRCVVHGTDAATLDAALAAAKPADAARRGSGVAFVFAGNGAQLPNMARSAMAGSATFRAAIAAAEAELTPLLGWSVAEVIAAGATPADLAATERAQPLLYAVQLGIVAALAAHGIRPALCLGHSVGEVAAAAVAGALTPRAAARLIVARSRAQQSTSGSGRMAALGVSAAAARPVLAECGPGLEVAAINAPGAITVAGPAPAIARLAVAAAARRWTCVELDLDHAFHSAAMDPARAPLRQALRGLRAATPRVPWISTVTGAAGTVGDGDAEYWWRNLREPVQFLDAVRFAAAAQPALFLEIGPQPVLQAYLRECLAAAGSDAGSLGTLSPRDPPGDPFPAIADRAFLRGADPRDAPRFAGPATRRGLPKTPFDRTRVTVEPTIEALPLVPAPPEHRLLGCRREAAPGIWSRLLDTRLEPWLADHAFAGEALLPAAAMLEIALAAGRARHPDAVALDVTEFAIHRPLALAQDHTREVETRLAADGGFTLSSRPRLGNAAWTLHASGRVAALPRLPPTPPRPEATGALLDGRTLRARAAACGLVYGPAFAAVREALVDRTAGIACVTLDRPNVGPVDAEFLLHPARLDGGLQGLFALLDATGAEAWLPVRIERLTCAVGAAPAVSAGVGLRAVGARSIASDLVLRDAAGLPIAALTGCWLQRARRPRGETVDDIAFHTVLTPTAVATPPATPLPAIMAAATSGGAHDAQEQAALLAGYCAAAAHAAALQGLPPGPQVEALLRHLERAGLALPGPHGPHPVADPELPPATAIWRQALLEAPGAAPELALAAAAAERLTQPGAVAAVAPPFGAGWAALVAALGAAAAAVAADWPPGRMLRVLGIAADGAGLVGPLAVALADGGRPVRLCVVGSNTTLPCVTDVEIARLDWDPFGCAAPPATFDLVVGAGAAMAARMGMALLPALRPALAPGGLLLLAEPLPSLFWDFCAGQDPAWWSRPTGPLPDLDEWAAAGAGWAERLAVPLHRGTWPAVLLAARRGAALPAAARPLPRRFCLFAEPAATATAAALAAALTARGTQVARRAFRGEAASLPRDLRDRHVVVLLDGPDATLPATLAATAELAAASSGHAAGWHLVTRGGAQPEGGHHRPRGAAAAAWGRVLANEYPALAPCRLDLCPSLDPAAAAARLLPELLGETDGEPEVTLGASARLVPRLHSGLPIAPPPAGPAILEVTQTGQLASLRWTAAPSRLPGPGEVRLRVDAAGLNFRDLMWAQGLLPESLLLDGFTGAGLGMECAGTVEAVGDGVALRPGDAVFGIAPAALASHVVTRATALVRRPAGLHPTTAAALPVAFLTALHAIEMVAGLAAGERVLIHASAGAVGLAALQVARGRGARIAATAGTEAKRAFLRAAGAELVLDSRDAGFADAIRAAWGDADGSVDVVLNSLAGDAMERSLGLLRPFGRFLELGKRDFVAQHRVALAPLRRNASFHAIDIDALPRERPAVAARLLAEVAARLADGRFHPIPATVFAAADVEGAFRAMQAATLIGKIVVTPPPPHAASPTAAEPLAAALAGVTVVIGGTSGFGLEAARWLARRGAARLALVSRRGTVAREILAEFSGRASVHACDATDPAALAATLADIRATTGRIAGVVHAAALLADGAAVSLEPSRIAAVLAAKLGIAENLDRLTEADRPDLFLLFSSAAVPVGNPGQAAYVAANAAMEALARRRRAAGRPALAVRWGPIADAGMLAAADAGTVAALQRRLGAVPMPAQTALDALPALLAAPAGEFGLAAMHWAQATALPLLAEPAFAAVATRADASAGDDLRLALRDADATVALGLLRSALAAAVGQILRLPAAQIAPDAPLATLGLDSLGSLELGAAIEAMLGQGAPVVTLSETLTLEQLARQLLASVPAAPPAVAPLEAAA